MGKCAEWCSATRLGVSAHLSRETGDGVMMARVFTLGLEGRERRPLSRGRETGGKVGSHL